MKNSVLVLSLGALLTAGCASADLRADVAAARKAAEQANLNAQDAKAIAIKTDEKLNRMFRKAQMK